MVDITNIFLVTVFNLTKYNDKKAKIIGCNKTVGHNIWLLILLSELLSLSLLHSWSIHIKYSNN